MCNCVYNITYVYVPCFYHSIIVSIPFLYINFSIHVITCFGVFMSSIFTYMYNAYSLFVCTIRDGFWSIAWFSPTKHKTNSPRCDAEDTNYPVGLSGDFWVKGRTERRPASVQEVFLCGENKLVNHTGLMINLGVLKCSLRALYCVVVHANLQILIKYKCNKKNQCVKTSNKLVLSNTNKNHNMGNKNMDNSNMNNYKMNNNSFNNMMSTTAPTQRRQEREGWVGAVSLLILLWQQSF